MGERSESEGVKCLEVGVEGVRGSGGGLGESNIMLKHQDKNKMSLNFSDIHWHVRGTKPFLQTPKVKLKASGKIFNLGTEWHVYQNHSYFSQNLKTLSVNSPNSCFPKLC